MDTFLHEVRYAARTLLKRPAFTGAAVLCLALGIGANTAIFSVVNAVLLKPLPYREPARLVGVWERSAERGRERNVVSPANFLDWRAQNTVFEEMAAFVDRRMNLTGSGEPEEVPVQFVTASFFPLLGARPMLGRTFTAAEDVPGGADVVVLSHALWQRRLGGAADAIGKPMMVDGQPRTVVGVMPATFAIAGEHEQPLLWVPLRLDPARNYREAAGRFMRSIARLKPGVTAEQADAQLRAIARRLEEAYPSFNAGWSTDVVRLDEQVVGDVRRPLLVLFGVVGFVLLIACANVANLQLAQATARQREIAVRAALGAGRGQIARQLLTESALLAVAGAALGVLLAFWATEAIGVGAAVLLPRAEEVALDGRALAFTGSLALLTGLAFGLVPALFASRADLQDTLKSGGRSGTPGGGRARAALVVAQVALSLVLLVGAGLMLKSFARLQGVDPGFDPDNVLTARIGLSGEKYRTDAQTNAFFQELLRRVSALPGVESAGAVSWLPFGGLGAATRYAIAGRPAPQPGQEPGADVRAVDPGYFRAMKIPLLRGASFSERDSRDSRTVVVISEALARTQFPNVDPIGQRIIMEWGDTLNAEIVGVVGDVRGKGLDSLPRETLYWARPQFPGQSFMSLVVRTKGDPMRLAGAVRGAVRAIDPNQPLADVRTMDSYLGDSVARRRFNAALLAGFAAVALLLAAVGLYGVMSYAVVQHTRELGIRMALGASTRAVLHGVLRQALVLAAIGVVVGVAGALTLTRVLSGLLYEVSATDPAVFAAIALLLTAVTLLASYIPARRATQVDPMVALRSE